MKYSISTLFLLLFSINLAAQNVNIPDANFKAYLVKNKKINLNLDDEIDISEAKRSFDFSRPKFILDERSEAIMTGVELL